MRKVTILNNTIGFPIHLNHVLTELPVFAKKDGNILGMVTHEHDGFALRLGVYLVGKYYTSLEECIKNESTNGYEFYVDY